MLHILYFHCTFDPVTQKVKQSNGLRLETDSRKQQILKAAIKRFSHFGVDKTTMNEIAEDSSISKGNLYYYFKDKNELITEVIKELLDQFNTIVGEKLTKTETTLDSLKKIQDVQKLFFEKYYMLNLFEGLACSSNNDSISQISNLVSKSGNKLIFGVFEKGVKNGELEISNLKETTELYVQATKGILAVNRNLSPRKITIDLELMNSIHNKQMELAKIFIKALSKN